jgi:hypothetical protein
MGEAKRRGSYEQRRQKAIEKQGGKTREQIAHEYKVKRRKEWLKAREERMKNPSFIDRVFQELGIII